MLEIEDLTVEVDWKVESAETFGKGLLEIEISGNTTIFEAIKGLIV